MRILITGGAGFVGKHLIAAIGANAEIFVLGLSSPAQARSGVQYFETDIRDSDRVRNVVRAVNPDRIFHLAAISSAEMCKEDPRLAYEVNVLGTYNVLEAALSLANPVRVLNVSSSQVYADSMAFLTETSPIAATNVYSSSKAMAELLIVPHQNAGGVITVRPFNHSGPGQSPNFVLSSIAQQFAEMQLGQKARNLSVGNLNVRRDFSDVRDVVRAYLLVLEHGHPGEVYNVCSGTSVSIAEIVDMFREITGIEAEVEASANRMRSNDPANIQASPRKLHLHTGWAPQIPLRQTLADLVEYWTTTIQTGESALDPVA